MGICGKYTNKNGDLSFGEHNQENEPHGRGIEFSIYDAIRIGYFDNGGVAPGTNYIHIYSDGNLYVGE